AHARGILFDARHRRAVTESRAEPFREGDWQRVVAALDVVDAVRIDAGDVGHGRLRNRARKRRRRVRSGRCSGRRRAGRQRLRGRGGRGGYSGGGGWRRGGDGGVVLGGGDEGVAKVARNRQREAGAASVAHRSKKPRRSTEIAPGDAPAFSRNWAKLTVS